MGQAPTFPMPSDQRWLRAATASSVVSSNEEMACPNENEDQHKKREEKTAQDLLATEFHW
jgi:hypothetical protein